MAGERQRRRRLRHRARGEHLRLRHRHCVRGRRLRARARRVHRTHLELVAGAFGQAGNRVVQRGRSLSSDVRPSLVEAAVALLPLVLPLDKRPAAGHRRRQAQRAAARARRRDRLDGLARLGQQRRGGQFRGTTAVAIRLVSVIGVRRQVHQVHHGRARRHPGTSVARGRRLLVPPAFRVPGDRQRCRRRFHRALRQGHPCQGRESLLRKIRRSWRTGRGTERVVGVLGFRNEIRQARRRSAVHGRAARTVEVGRVRPRPRMVRQRQRRRRVRHRARRQRRRWRGEVHVGDFIRRVAAGGTVCRIGVISRLRQSGQACRRRVRGHGGAGAGRSWGGLLIPPLGGPVG